MPSLNRCLLAILLHAAVTGSAVAGVIVVDPAGGPGATLLQAALTSAQSGDIVLLREGDYTSPGAPTFIAHSGIVITADVGVTPTLAGLGVSLFPPAPTLLRGLTIEPVPLPGIPKAPLLIGGNQGRIWMEDCRSIGRQATEQFPGTPSLFVNTTSITWIIGGEYEGGAGLDSHVKPDGTLFTGLGGGNGVEFAAVKAVILHRVKATGGVGANGTSQSFGAGGKGAFIYQGPLTLQGTASVAGATIMGGAEGADAATSGHSGIGLETSFGMLQLRDTSIAAGMVSGDGLEAPALLLGGTGLTEFDAVTRSLKLSSPVRELQEVTVTVQGTLGDLAVAFVAIDFNAQTVISKQGTYAFPEPAAFMVPLGPITDPSGALVLHPSMPRLPTGVDGMVLFTQLGVVTAQGEALLGTGSSVVWLSATL